MKPQRIRRWALTGGVIGAFVLAGLGAPTARAVGAPRPASTNAPMTPPVRAQRRILCGFIGLLLVVEAYSGNAGKTQPGNRHGARRAAALTAPDGRLTVPGIHRPEARR